jgi:hypothetical protein
MRWCGVILAAAMAAAGGTAFAAEYGTVKGQFVLDGPAPGLKPLVVKGDPTAKDPAVCAKDNVPDESLVVDPESHGIANIFVWLRKAPADIHPDLKESKDKVVKFDQRGCRFFPHAMVLRTDQTVAILSGDPIGHNTHVVSISNRGENQTIPGEDREGRVRWQFKLPERFVTNVKCDIHAWMTAWWLIIDHPYAAVTDKDGKFTIEKVPAGEHEFQIWQEKSGWVFGPKKRTIKVDVPANGTADLGTLKVPVAAFLK